MDHFKFSVATREILEDAFAECPLPSPAQLDQLASKAGITRKQTSRWFRNRRHRGGDGRPGADATADDDAASYEPTAGMGLMEPRESFGTGTRAGGVYEGPRLPPDKAVAAAAAADGAHCVSSVWAGPCERALAPVYYANSYPETPSLSLPAAVTTVLDEHRRATAVWAELERQFRRPHGEHEPELPSARCQPPLPTNSDGQLLFAPIFPSHRNENVSVLAYLRSSNTGDIDAEVFLGLRRMFEQRRQYFLALAPFFLTSPPLASTSPARGHPSPPLATTAFPSQASHPMDCNRN